LEFHGFGLAKRPSWNWRSRRNGHYHVKSSLTDFIDSNGYVYLLARTTNPSDGATAAVLYCDYVGCVVTVEGITYVDIVSYRDEDQVNVKPFIWRTEFTVKSWLSENIQAT